MGMGHMVRIEAMSKAFLERGFSVSMVIPAFPEGLDHAGKFLGGQGEIIPVDPCFALSEELPEEFPYCEVAFFDCLRNPPERLRKAREKASCIALFDDDGVGVLEADLAFNPLYMPRLSARQLADKEVEIFDEPKYMPLRKEFDGFDHGMHKVNGKKKLLLLQGGVDGWNGMVRILRLIDKVRNDIIVVPVTGPAYAHADELRETIEKMEVEVEWKRDQHSMPEVMAECDAAVSACGLSIFELLCMGLPSLALTDEPREIETASRLEQRGCLISLGLLREIDDEVFAEGLRQVLDNAERRSILSRISRKAVDGRGAEHVAKAVMSRMKKVC